MFHAIFLVGLLFAGPLQAAEVAESAPAATEDMAALEAFLRLSDEELDELIAALQRVRAMSAEERAVFGERIREFRALPGEQRRTMRESWRQRGRPDNEAWRRHVQSLEPEERARLQRQLETLAPAERRTFREEILEAAKRGETAPEP